MLKKFPKSHLLAAAGVSICILTVAGIAPTNNAEAKRVISTTNQNSAITNQSNSTESLPIVPEVQQFSASAIENQPQHSSIKYIIQETLDNLESSSGRQPPSTAEKNKNWHNYTIKQGDTLSKLFERAGFNNSNMLKVVNDNKANKALARIYPGEEMSFLSGEDGELKEIKLKRNKLEQIIVKPDASGIFTLEDLSLEPEVRTVYTQGTVDSSLFIAGKNAGLSQKLTMELANIFGWDIDFVLDIRKGDKFSVLYEKLYLDGEFIKEGKILTATFTNRGNTHQAVHYTSKNGMTSYYTPEGKSMRKAFLRTPVDFARISSHFNLKRKHPILHKIRAHKGTDYAAATGTPIRASGDGKVILAGRKGGYGKTVVLQHGSKITTLYAHMKSYAKGIRNGKSVKQGQIIGYVGSTGLASGPHLHYEFRVNGAPKNPLKVKFPNANPISKAEKQLFLSQTMPVLATMIDEQQTYEQQIALGTNINKNKFDATLDKVSEAFDEKVALKKSM